MMTEVVHTSLGPFVLVPVEVAKARGLAVDGARLPAERSTGSGTLADAFDAPKASGTKRRPSRVVYVRLLALGHPKVQELPSSDQLVYRRISRSKRGTTRKALLTGLKAQQHTGRVDGALRRLRLRGLIRTSESWE